MTWNHSWNTKKGHISRGDQHDRYLEAFQRFANKGKKANREVAFSSTSLSNILKYRETFQEIPVETFQQPGNRIPSDTYWEVQLICIKVPTDSSSEPPLEHNNYQTSTRIQSVMTFWVTGTLCSFRLVLEGKTTKEIPESARLEILEKIQQTNLSYQIQKTIPQKH